LAAVGSPRSIRLAGEVELVVADNRVRLEMARSSVVTVSVVGTDQEEAGVDSQAQEAGMRQAAVLAVGTRAVRRKARLREQVRTSVRAGVLVGRPGLAAAR